MSRSSTLVSVATIVMAMLAQATSAYPQTPGQDVQRAAQLAAQWSRLAHAQFEAANAYTSDQSGEMLEQLIARGAARAVSERASDDRIRAAGKDIQRFADRMLKEGVRQPDGRIRLGETSFGAASRDICPIYPFC